MEDTTASVEPAVEDAASTEPELRAVASGESLISPDGVQEGLIAGALAMFALVEGMRLKGSDGTGSEHISGPTSAVDH